MAATKRKRRGDLEVQAKKPKRSRKDTGKPAKQAAVTNEVEEEDRDRIPGPVCKVKGPAPGLCMWRKLRDTLIGYQRDCSQNPLDCTGQCVC